MFGRSDHMARSYHVTERQRRRDNYLNRGDDGQRPTGLSEIDVLSLKKTIAKINEDWKRDTKKAGGIRRTELSCTDNVVNSKRVKCRGILSYPSLAPEPVKRPKRSRKKPTHKTS